LTANVAHARRVVRAQPQAVGSLRVLQVVLSLDPGGTERLVLELVRRLQRDIPMAVCCLERDGAWAADLRREGVTVTALGRETGFHPSLGRLVADLAGTHDATVLHCHHYSPFVYGCLARLWSPRLRIVFTEHGRLSDSGPSRKRRLANAVLARVPAAVFAVSNDLKDHPSPRGSPPARSKSSTMASTSSLCLPRPPAAACVVSSAREKRHWSSAPSPAWIR
jgi:hypothetical protein